MMIAEHEGRISEAARRIAVGLVGEEKCVSVHPYRLRASLNVVLRIAPCVFGKVLGTRRSILDAFSDLLSLSGIGGVGVRVEVEKDDSLDVGSERTPKNWDQKGFEALLREILGICLREAAVFEARNITEGVTVYEIRLGIGESERAMGILQNSLPVVAYWIGRTMDHTVRIDIIPPKER